MIDHDDDHDAARAEAVAQLRLRSHTLAEHYEADCARLAAPMDPAEHAALARRAAARIRESYRLTALAARMTGGELTPGFRDAATKLGVEVDWLYAEPGPAPENAP